MVRSTDTPTHWSNPQLTSADKNGRGWARRASPSLNQSHPRLAGFLLSPCRFFVTALSSRTNSSKPCPLAPIYTVILTLQSTSYLTVARLAWCSHPVLLKRERLPLRPEAFRTARCPPPLSPHQSRPGPNQRALAICRRGWASSGLSPWLTLRPLESCAAAQRCGSPPIRVQLAVSDQPHAQSAVVRLGGLGRRYVLVAFD